jgi:hypothetical protein
MKPLDAAACDAAIIAPCCTNAAVATSMMALATRRMVGYRLNRTWIYYAILKV